MTLLETLSAIKNSISIMKGKPGDALYFGRDSYTGEMVLYLVSGGNFVRYTQDTIIPEYEQFREEVIFVDILMSLLSLDENEMMKRYNDIRIPGRGMLVYGKTSVSDYIADSRYKDIVNTVWATLRYTQVAPVYVLDYPRFDMSHQWELYKSLKASDGSKYVSIGDYVMYLFSGLIPTVKDDQVDLRIFDNQTDACFMACFTVTKYKSTKKETRRLYSYTCIFLFFKI